MLVSWRWRSFHKSFTCAIAFAKITVHDLDKCLLVCLMLARKSNVQTAKCPRLARFVAEAVTTFPSGITSATAIFVKSRSATIASSSVYSAARNSAPSAKIMTIAKIARYHCVFIAKNRSTVLSARRHSATTVKSPSGVQGAKQHSVKNAKTVTAVKRATRHPVLIAKV